MVLMIMIGLLSFLCGGATAAVLLDRKYVFVEREDMAEFEGLVDLAKSIASSEDEGEKESRR